MAGAGGIAAAATGRVVEAILAGVATAVLEADGTAATRVGTGADGIVVVTATEARDAIVASVVVIATRDLRAGRLQPDLRDPT